MFALAPATRLAHVIPWLHRLALIEPLWWKHIVQRLDMHFYSYEQLHFVEQPIFEYRSYFREISGLQDYQHQGVGQFFNRVTT